jgi:hypothetical protein
MMTRDEILERLQEPMGTLKPEELAEARKQAVADPEVALALRHCEAMAKLSEEEVFGGPATSDVEFVVALRRRLEGPAPSPARGAFGTARQLALVGTACVFLMALVLSAGRWPATSNTAPADQTAARFVDALETASLVPPDSLDDSTVSAESLAVYLDMPEFVSSWDFDGNSDQPLSDLLLSLDTQSLQEVLNNLEDTNFF